MRVCSQIFRRRERESGRERVGADSVTPDPDSRYASSSHTHNFFPTSETKLLSDCMSEMPVRESVPDSGIGINSTKTARFLFSCFARLSLSLSSQTTDVLLYLPIVLLLLIHKLTSPPPPPAAAADGLRPLVCLLRLLS